MKDRDTQDGKGCLGIAPYIPAIALVLWGVGLVIDSHVNFDTLTRWTLKPIGVANAFAWFFGSLFVAAGGIAAFVTWATIRLVFHHRHGKKNRKATED